MAVRVGTATSSGVVDDAIGLEVRDMGVVALKPILGKSFVTDIDITSLLQIVTIRPGCQVTSFLVMID